MFEYTLTAGVAKHPKGEIVSEIRNVLKLHKFVTRFMAVAGRFHGSAAAAHPENLPRTRFEAERKPALRRPPAAPRCAMRRSALALATAAALALLPGAAPAGARDVRPLTDGAGRTVMVPTEVSRVFAGGPPAGLVLYSLAPQKMLGWAMAPSRAALGFLGRDADLPVYGRLAGRGGEANLETVLRLKPDLIVDIGMTTGTFLSLADKVQGATGIPYLLLDGRLQALPATYRLLGRALGAEAAAEERARWIETRLDAITQKLAAVPQDARPRVYLARGPSGLESARTGSINVEAVEAAGGRNVVGDALGSGGLVTLSMEQVLAFDPDVIVALDPAFFARLATDPAWRELRAVKAGKAVLAPQLPFPWVDYPPSVNRVLGVVWLAALLYPEQMDRDVAGAAKAFYPLFYHRDLTGAELEALLANAVFK